MTKLKYILGAGLVAAGALGLAAAVTAQQLGADLTPMGAEKAGERGRHDPGVERRAEVGGRRRRARVQVGRASPGSVRRRQAGLQDRRIERHQVRGQPDRGPQGAARRLQGQLLHERLSDAPQRGVPAAHLRCGQGECRFREADGQRQRRHGRDRRPAVPDAEVGRRGHLEPHPALPRGHRGARDRPGGGDPRRQLQHGQVPRRDLRRLRAARARPRRRSTT